jgi:hypothetical protein
MKISIVACFDFIVMYIKSDYLLDPDDWEVKDLLRKAHEITLTFQAQTNQLPVNLKV